MNHDPWTAGSDQGGPPVAPPLPHPSANPLPPPLDPSRAAVQPAPPSIPGRTPSIASLRRRGWFERVLIAISPYRRRRGADAVMSTTPPWLISLLLHTVLLLVLGLWWIPELPSNVMELTLNFADSLGDQLEIETVEIGADQEDLEHVVVTPEDLPEVDQPLLAPPTPPITPVSPMSGSELTIPDVGYALSGREAGMKRVLLAAYGGNAVTEAAVAEGLEWLKRNQLKDGSWSLTGPYRDGAQNENPTSATAMALLAFQGAGHTHLSGAHAEVVKRGSRALLKMQNGDGDFWSGTVGHHRLYSQAQAMIAVCELYGMTKDSQLRTAAERSVDYAVRTQDKLGGWRYQPGYDSDTSVSGWFMMGLQSARMSGLEVPSATLEHLDSYLDRVASFDGARFGYQPGMEPTYAMTAEALLCRQYLGWTHDDSRMATGVNLILSRPIDWNDRDVYYWYYATQVLHHLNGEAWEAWNGVMRQLLPAQQTRQGAERGSWSPLGDRWGPHGGRLYVTCLSLYMLEVYYRHLPIYASRGPL